MPLRDDLAWPNTVSISLKFGNAFLMANQTGSRLFAALLRVFLVRRSFGGDLAIVIAELPVWVACRRKQKKKRLIIEVDGWFLDSRD